jgi:hypothetical protein
MAKITEQISKSFQGLPPWAKGAIAVGVVAGVAFIGFKIFRKFGGESARETQEANQLENELNTELNKTGLTYPKSQYSTFANEIETAGFDIGTDEDAIYSVFRKLKNNADYLQLNASWGKPNRKVYDFGIGRDMTLPQFLRYEMNDGEIRKINQILSYNKITYRV